MIFALNIHLHIGFVRSNFGHNTFAIIQIILIEIRIENSDSTPQILVEKINRHLDKSKISSKEEKK